MRSRWFNLLWLVPVRLLVLLAQVKWLAGIEFVRDYGDVGGGFGGYNEDHEFFGYRQSI